jgi:hypothetical protein
MFRVRIENARMRKGTGVGIDERGPHHRAAQPPWFDQWFAFRRIKALRERECSAVAENRPEDAIDAPNERAGFAALLWEHFGIEARSDKKGEAIPYARHPSGACELIGIDAHHMNLSFGPYRSQPITIKLGERGERLYMLPWHPAARNFAEVFAWVKTTIQALEGSALIGPLFDIEPPPTAELRDHIEKGRPV